MNLFIPLQGLLTALSLPLQRRMARLVYPPGTQPADFLQPPGEASLLAPDSLSWRIFANPVAMFVGGVAAVLLELAEPRVRTACGSTRRSANNPCCACNAPATPRC